MIETTEWAREILRKAHDAARRFNPTVHIRLARAGAGIQPLLAESPEDGDEPIEIDGVTVWIAAGFDGLIDIEEPHDHIVLRPAGSVPNERAH